ncbi:MAG: ABC transporter substrate-binding protein [Elusimicrobiaceae bacterium]|jgi:peptide/nickel transport system substrate-binding protein
MKKTFSLKSILAPAFLCLCLAPLSAAGAFVTALPGKPYTLDPAGMYDRYSVMAAVNVYEPLVAFGTASYHSDFQPMLSTEVPTKENGLLSEDGRTYTFPIRKGIKFHDGTELTAEDVRYSLIRLMLADRIEGPSVLFLKPIMGVNSTRDGKGNISISFADAEKAVRAEGNNVIVTLKRPYSPFLSLLAAWPFTVSKAWCAANGEWDGTEATWKKYNNRPRENSYLRDHANGTGPFKLESVAPQTGRMVLARNENYWREPAKLERLVFMTEPSEFTRQALIETGDADYAEFDRTSLKDLEKVNGVTIIDGIKNHSTGDFIAFTFKIDTASNPMTGSGKLDGKGIPSGFFSSQDVRKGFAYAFDYEKFFREVLMAKGVRMTTPVARAAAPKDAPFTYNPAKAEELLKKAFGGKVWKNGFKLEAQYNLADPQAHAIIAILAESLKKLNPKFDLRARPATYSDLKLGIRGKRTPMYIKRFEPDYPAYYNYASSLMHSDGLIAKGELYSNPKADKACENILYYKGSAEREKFLGELDKIYAQDAPFILLFSPEDFKVFRSGITGMDDNSGIYAIHNFVNYYKVKEPASQN